MPGLAWIYLTWVYFSHLEVGRMRDACFIDDGKMLRKKEEDSIPVSLKIVTENFHCQIKHFILLVNGIVDFQRGQDFKQRICPFARDYLNDVTPKKQLLLIS